MSSAKKSLEVKNHGDSKKKVDKLKGADILIKALEYEGVDTIFGYPGGAVLPIYDSIYHCKTIRHILPRHEQGAAHAADGYARSTGKPGVCVATSGPGATNLITGITTAYMDSIPMIIFTGQVPSGNIGKDSFQEADITGIVLPITKHAVLVKDVKELAKTIREAFHIATTGRPGPVLIDIPKDITVEETEFEYPPQIYLPGYRLATEGRAGKQIERACKLIKEAKKPVIIAGGGVIHADASEALLQFAEKLKSPVANTVMGKGSFPGDHELYLGTPGMHGSACTNYAVTEADLLIAVGMRFSDRVTGDVKSFAPNAKIIQIDIDAAEINKNVLVDLPIIGNARDILERLNQSVEPLDTENWLSQIKSWKKDYPLSYCQEKDTIKPQYILEKINNIADNNSFYVVDTGQHQMWAAQYLCCRRPRSFMTSGGLGTMGFSFPASIGVQIAQPDSDVITIVGDGSFQMNSQELATAVHYKLPLNIFIFNNYYLGMVRQWQDLFFGKRYSHVEITQPDFVKLAESYGAVGIRVEKAEEVEDAIRKSLETPKTVVIDFRIEKEENVFPMVPAGGAIDKMLGR